MRLSLKKHVVPATLYGYLFQVERAVCWLIGPECKAGMRVGIESLDDVSVSDKDGNVLILEQAKATTSGSNNVADGSEALWKTLATWAVAIESGEVDGHQTHFRLVTTARVDSGVAKSLSDASSAEAGQEALISLKAYAKHAPTGISHFVDQVLSCRDETLLALIRHFLLRDQQDMGSLKGIAKELGKNPILVDCEIELLDSIANTLWGWVARRTADSISKRQPTWIDRDTLARELSNQVGRQYDIRRKRRVLEAANRLVISPEQKAAQKDSAFVRQLNILNAPEDIILDAVDDYLLSCIDRIGWAEHGLVPQEDLDQFDTDLLQFWRLIRLRQVGSRVGIASEAEISLGLAIYADTMAHRERLCGQPTEQWYTTRGRYHWLADDVRVGWHPRFNELITTGAAHRSESHEASE